MKHSEMKKVVNELGQQVFAIVGEDSFFRVYEDEVGNRYAKIGDEFESLGWLEQQRYKITLWVDAELEAMYDAQGL